MILHLLSDDKFTDYAINQFESIDPKNNEFIILVWNNTKKCSNIENLSSVRVIEEESKELNQFCTQLDKYRAIIAHNLSTPSQIKIIQNANIKTKIAWVFWGFELYHRNKIRTNYYSRRTKKLYHRFIFRKSLNNVYRFSTLRKYNKTPYEVPSAIFKTIDYCLTDMTEDYNKAKEYFNADFKFLWYNYYNIDETVGSLKNGKISGNNILIGNSATFSNNHLEVFDTLSKLNLGKRKLILPLSYGDKDYADNIIQKGKCLFGNQITPLMDFMERDAYNKIIQSCSIVIMNQYRHQAMGNIITALWLGAKAFLSEKSTTYTYFKRLGINIYSIEKDLNQENKNIFEPLGYEIVKQNRKILGIEYDRKVVHNHIKDLITKLNQTN